MTFTNVSLGVVTVAFGISAMLWQRDLAQANANTAAVSAGFSKHLTNEYVGNNCNLSTKQFALYDERDKLCVTDAEARARDEVAKFLSKK
ncbi:MAG: hypothetical protein RLZZ26_24 [Candidatus Parcubacteria bacterium]|jgi:hypothetical protein